MKNLLPFLLIIFISCQKNISMENLWTYSFQALQPQDIGKVEEQSFYSQTLQKDWHFNVYYPPGYNPQKKYSVIYLLHGAYGNYKDWKVLGEAQIMLDRAIAAKKLPPVIAIMPDGLDSWYADTPNLQVQSAFEKELFPYIEENFPLQNTKESRAIGGLSMGGYGALVFGMRNPAYFGTVFALSPAITILGKSPSPDLLVNLEKDFTHLFENKFSQEKWDNISYIHAYNAYKGANSPIRFLVAVGTDDVITPAEDSRELIKQFQQDKIAYKYIEVPSGSHSWGFWTLMLGPSFEYAGEKLPAPQ